METTKRIRSFRDLTIWKDAIFLVKVIYKITETLPDSEAYGLTSQIRRAAVSVPSNIAEEHIRRHTSEFRQFLFVALGSLAELETRAIIANELGYIGIDSLNKVVQSAEILGKQIRSLISKLNPNPRPQTPASR